MGYDADFNVDVGVMTTERQVKNVKDHLEDALAKGAVVYARSGPPQGNDSGKVLPAVVLTEVTKDMLVMREETFGPVLGVTKVKNMDEAIAFANDSNYGLSGSVWSKNGRNAMRLARKIQAGAVTINDHLMSHGLAETPWGGFKHSGIGRTHGAIGFDEMTQPQVIVNDVLPFARHDLWWHPHGERIFQGLVGATKFLYGKSVVERFKGLYHLVRIVPRYFSTGE